MSEEVKRSKLVILSGLPGSGKSTLARSYIATGYVCVSRDSIRLTLNASYEMINEPLVSAIQDAMIETLLSKGEDIVLDNTHYKMAYIKEVIKKYGSRTDITFRLVGDQLTLSQIKLQNISRDKAVPEAVIDFMYPAWQNVKKNVKEINAYIAEMSEVTPVKSKLFKQDDRLPHAIIVDIDGTIAHMGDLRGPFDWKKVGGDIPDQNVLGVIRALNCNYHIFFVSGRDEVCRPETEAWLNAHYGLAYEGLFMRPKGDFRKDSLVKEEIFNREFRNKYYIEMLFDDRDQVVRKYREMGLKVAQVAYGDF